MLPSAELLMGKLTINGNVQYIKLPEGNFAFTTWGSKPWKLREDIPTIHHQLAGPKPGFRWLFWGIYDGSIETDKD